MSKRLTRSDWLLRLAPEWRHQIVVKLTQFYISQVSHVVNVNSHTFQSVKLCSRINQRKQQTLYLRKTAMVYLFPASKSHSVEPIKPQKINCRPFLQHIRQHFVLSYAKWLCSCWLIQTMSVGNHLSCVRNYAMILHAQSHCMLRLWKVLLCSCD